VHLSILGNQLVVELSYSCAVCSMRSRVHNTVAQGSAQLPQ
jgi:hypothetical protein